MTNIEKQMEELGYYFTKYNDSYTLSTLKDGSVLFDFFCDSEEELKEGLIKDIKIHLQRIEDEDEKEMWSTKAKEFTPQIKSLRFEIKSCKRIRERSIQKDIEKLAMKKIKQRESRDERWKK